MGAANALAAYRLYGQLPDRPLRLLVYMSLVAKDKDAEPWCGIGHEALAEFGLGRKPPAAAADPSGHDQALRVVRRAITELANAGAIRTVRRATFGPRGTFPAKYRLYLTEPCHDNREVTQRRNPQVTRRPMGFESIGHSANGHRSLTRRPQVTERPTKEYEEEEERDNEGSVVNTKVEGDRVALDVVLNNGHLRPSTIRRRNAKTTEIITTVGRKPGINGIQLQAEIGGNRTVNLQLINALIDDGVIVLMRDEVDRRKISYTLATS